MRFCLANAVCDFLSAGQHVTWHMALESARRFLTSEFQKNIRHAWSESVEVDCIATTADALHSLHRINLNFDDFTLTLNFENFAFCYARTKAWFIQLQLPNPVGGYKQSEMCLAANLTSGVCLMNCCMVVTAPGWMRLCGHCPSFCQTFRTGCW